MMTPDELERRLVLALDAIRRNVNSGLGDWGESRVGWDTVALFGEDAGGGYTGIEQAFDDVVRIATKLWGAPSKVGFGRGSVDADVAGVPERLLDSRALRYAFWSNRVVVATVAMLPHDADSLRSFEARMVVPRS